MGSTGDANFQCSGLALSIFLCVLRRDADCKGCAKAVRGSEVIAATNVAMACDAVGMLVAMTKAEFGL